eukprot:CAMPEP_0172552878 /NCGR_PEP_ID=MMETSP1067-20121228/47246_1 /TAXON_ID=265564 ORGANISM="Thalassiosira punctigera, Strain Tpunct2005C2" /NCGR_SAMPLE_ID=MMETSP1067 /ASSEMBLY_ACC=CAM_ASM_000444 /LENGTH=367 /DNA_ID=CAMNT_0013340951 /DNA_START=179 /DNA_END=1278 /DNA_ORIENTATION=-
MQCILIGVPHSDSSEDVATTWIALTRRVGNIEGVAIEWIAHSTCHDEGTPTLLLCAAAASDLCAEDVVAATSAALGVGTCELWASSPAILPLRPPSGYGGRLRLPARDGDPREEWASSAMKEWGLFAQSGLINGREVDALRRCVDGEIACMEKLLTLHRPDVRIGKDVMSFREISSRGKERFDLLLHPTSEAHEFVERVILGRVSSLVEKILDGRTRGGEGGDIEFDVGVVYSKPGAPRQGWHADGDHQRGTEDAGWDVKTGWRDRLAKPYALCLFVPLIDLDEETGYTRFWPASHRNRGLVGFGPVAEMTGATWDGRCRAGDVVWYDYRLMHRGMENRSRSLRPVLQVLFRKSWYAEKRNYGTDSV